LLFHNLDPSDGIEQMRTGPGGVGAAGEGVLRSVTEGAALRGEAVSRGVGDEERPTVVIRRRDSWFGLELRGLWEYRELVYFMVWKDIKTRYKQTAIGVGWAVLQPLATAMILTVVFSYVASVPSEGVPYPIFAFAALLPWTYLSQAVTRSGGGLVANANLISKVYFPRVIVPLAAVVTPMVDLLLTFAMIAVLMVWYGIQPGLEVLFLPLFVGFAFLTALAVGLWLSALNVKYRDVAHVIPFLVQIWMYASPVAYPASQVPGGWRLLYGLNPLVTIIDGFRWCLLRTNPPQGDTAALSAAVTMLLLAGGLVYFKATERTFADVI
jgi:lipopolysaccharide transport system permease protein